MMWKIPKSLCQHHACKKGTVAIKIAQSNDSVTRPQNMMAVLYSCIAEAAIQALGSLWSSSERKSAPLFTALSATTIGTIQSLDQSFHQMYCF
jgi:hypothetical protein